MKLQDQYKTHETEQDRTRQKEILDAWCEGMDCKYGLTDNFSAIDGLIYRNGKLEAVAEVKARGCEFGRYHDYTIDASKLEKLINYSEARGVKPILIVGFYSDNYMDIRWTVVHPYYPTSFQKRRDHEWLTPEVVT